MTETLTHARRRSNARTLEAVDLWFDTVKQAQDQTMKLVQAWLESAELAQERQLLLMKEIQQQAFDMQKFWRAAARNNGGPLAKMFSAEVAAEPARTASAGKTAVVAADAASPVPTPRSRGEKATRQTSPASPPAHFQVSDKVHVVTAPRPAIGREELVQAIALAAGTDTDRADIALKAMLDTIGGALEAGEEIRLAGFGTFKVGTTQARAGRNPRTGEVISIAAGRRPVFRASPALREAVE